MPIWNNPSTFQGYVTYATGILDPAEYPTLDADLRSFLARCLARDKRLHPGLEEMLEITQNAVLMKTPDSYKPNDANETDQAIGDLMKRLVFDANTTPD